MMVAITSFPSTATSGRWWWQCFIQIRRRAEEGKTVQKPDGFSKQLLSNARIIVAYARDHIQDVLDGDHESVIKIGLTSLYQYHTFRSLEDDMNAENVIDRIGGGGLRETARKLEVPVPTVQHWRRTGRVPEWRTEHIRKVARQLGVELDE